MMQDTSAALCAAVLVLGSSAASVRAAKVPASQFVKRTTVLSTGITMSYVETGPTGGEPVILLHGLSDTSRSFFQTMEALQAIDGGLRLFALDAATALRRSRWQRADRPGRRARRGPRLRDSGRIR